MFVQKPRSQPTYEGLKLYERLAKAAEDYCSQPTYEGLKQATVYLKAPHSCCSQPTYEGLKQAKGAGKSRPLSPRSQPTYEGLKLEDAYKRRLIDRKFPAYL